MTEYLEWTNSIDNMIKFLDMNKISKKQIKKIIVIWDEPEND